MKNCGLAPGLRSCGTGIAINFLLERRSLRCSHKTFDKTLRTNESSSLINMDDEDKTLRTTESMDLDDEDKYERLDKV